MFFLRGQPPRSAHPHVHFSCLDAEPMVIDKVPFDKYELEPSPLTQYILERKSPHTCWQVGRNRTHAHTHTRIAHPHTARTSTMGGGPQMEKN